MIKRGDLNAYKIGNKMRISNLEVDRYKKNALNNPVSASNSLERILVIGSENTSNYNTFSTTLIDEPVQRESGFIICGQDSALDTLAKHLQSYQHVGNRVLRSYVGSYNGLYMLYQGQASVATSHLWNGKNNTYNVSYVEHMIPGISVVLIRLFKRMQGFYVKKGNPKKIHTWDDLKRTDITITNREKGSGTRVLLDEYLKILGINPVMLAGYNKECFSHLAVAGAVARGSSDFGLGTISSVKIIPDIEFIPLQQECYDLVIKKDDMNKQLFQAVINIVRSDSFKMELEGINEYDISDLGKIIAET